MEGGFYLVQRVDIGYLAQRMTGLKYIAYDDANNNLKSYFVSNEGPGPFGGVALEYVYEVSDDTLTICGGFVGSPTRGPGSTHGQQTTVNLHQRARSPEVM